MQASIKKSLAPATPSQNSSASLSLVAPPLPAKAPTGPMSPEEEFKSAAVIPKALLVLSVTPIPPPQTYVVPTFENAAEPLSSS